MKLSYATAIATLIQFLMHTLLDIPNTLISIISTCHSNGSDCTTNTLASLVFFLLTTAWFAIVWVIGYAAQERRSKLLAWVLIGAEAATGLVALYFNARHYTNYFGLFTSLVDAALAAWVIVLAFRLSRAKGGRIVAKQRTRKHPPSLLP